MASMNVLTTSEWDQGIGVVIGTFTKVGVDNDQGRKGLVSKVIPTKTAKV